MIKNIQEKNQIKSAQSLYQESDPITVHDPFMDSLTFEGADLEIYEDLYAALTINVSGFNADMMITRIKEIYAENPDYHPNESGFRTLNIFMQYYAGLAYPYNQEFLQDYHHYELYVNTSWYSSYSMIPLTNKYFAQSPSVIGGRESLLFKFLFVRAVNGEMQDLIDAVRQFKYVLIHMGIGIFYAPMAQYKIYSNSKEYFVNNNHLGMRVPAGLSYLDFSQWDGKKLGWTKDDLAYTGD